MTHTDRLLAAAKAEDTYDLLNHIAWTDVLKPRLEKQVQVYSSLLIQEALGTPIPSGKTREQIAGICYGITTVMHLIEQILREGEKALGELQLEGIGLNSIAK